jgi:hypothetical protein
MRRTLSFVLVVAVAMVMGPGTYAQTTPSDSDDARYSYNRVDDGFLRLDIRSGEVSLCNRRAVGWACEIVPDDRSVFDKEIARLHGENAVLKKALLDHGLPLPHGVAIDAGGARSNDQKDVPPHDANVARVTALVGKVWRQLVDMIMNLQKDVLKQT